MSNITLSLTVH